MSSARLSDVMLIGGQPVTNIVNKTVQLDLNSAGRAMFEVVCEQEPSGLVELQLGYAIDAMTPYFLGVIESKHLANGRWFLTCRELIGALAFSAPLAIRHATISQVLAALDSRLEFITPNTEIMQTKVPAFYHNGTGIEALKQIGHVWQIPDYIWQQRPDGKIFVGSWHDSRWPAAAISDFPEHTIKATGTSTGELIAVPKLRPGLKINGRYITEVTLINNKMVIRWSSKLLNA